MKMIDWPLPRNDWRNRVMGRILTVLRETVMTAMASVMAAIAKVHTRHRDYE